MSALFRQWNWHGSLNGMVDAMGSEQTKPLRLNVLLAKEDGIWVARCPELDTLVADADMEKAWEDIVRVCRAHISYGLRSGKTLDELVQPPPNDIAVIMMQAQEEGRLRLHFDRKVVGEVYRWAVSA